MSLLSCHDWVNVRTHAYVCRLPWGSDGKETARSAGDPGLISRSGRPPGEGVATGSRILAWRIPRTEEPGRLQSMQSQESDMTSQLEREREDGVECAAVTSDTGHVSS